MTSELAAKKCKPCEGGEEPLKGDAIEKLRAQLTEGWAVVDEHHLERHYRFENFREALARVSYLHRAIG